MMRSILLSTALLALTALSASAQILAKDRPGGVDMMSYRSNLGANQWLSLESDLMDAFGAQLSAVDAQSDYASAVRSGEDGVFLLKDDGRTFLLVRGHPVPTDMQDTLADLFDIVDSEIFDTFSEGFNLVASPRSNSDEYRLLWNLMRLSGTEDDGPTTPLAITPDLVLDLPADTLVLSTRDERDANGQGYISVSADVPLNGEDAIALLRDFAEANEMDLRLQNIADTTSVMMSRAGTEITVSILESDDLPEVMLSINTVLQAP